MANDPANNGGAGYAGQAGITSPGSGHNARALQHRIQQDARRTTVAVRIIKTYGGGTAGAPTADVQPMIDQVDGLGYPTPHGPVYGVAVGRVHSGAGAIISDPQPGDIFEMHVHDRDITKLKNTGAQSSPDTARRGSMADGVLGHAMVTKAPDQYVMFKPEGGFVVTDRAGNIVETFKDSKMMTLTVPAGGILALGGNPAKGGTFGFVQTDQGVSTIVKAKL